MRRLATDGMRRLATTLIAVAVTLAVLGGCGGSGADPGSTQPVADGSQEGRPAHDQVDPRVDAADVLHHAVLEREGGPVVERRVRGCDTEWSLLYDEVARSAYPGVRRPLAGSAEFSPAGLEAETRAAMAAGIDAFLWCWYWDRGRLIFNEALDTFLDCRLPAGFRYALMWVNKRPHFELPLDRTLSAAEQRSRLVVTDEADFRAMVGHLAERHWSRPSYLTVRGRPLLPITIT